MAVASAGSAQNIELGFAPTATATISLGGTTAGYIESDVAVSVPRDYAFVRGALTPIKAVQTAKNMTVTLSCREVLLQHLQYAWDGDAAVSSVLTIDDDPGATIALLVKTYAPNSESVVTGSNEPISRVISVPKAIATGDGAYNIPKATSGDSNQSVSMDFIAIGDTASTELLGTVTDTYT